MKPNDWQDTIAMAASAIEDLLETADEHAGCWADVPARLRALTAPPAPAVPRVTEIPEAATLTNINQLCPLDNNLSQTDFATGWNDCRQYALTHDGVPPVIKGVHAAAQGWNACRAAMLDGTLTNEGTKVQPQIELQNIPNNIPDGCECTTIDYCENCMRGMLAQPVSQGYKLVPVEPTEEMIAAAMNCDDVEFNSDETFCINFDNIYRAMLATAKGGASD